MGKTLCDWSRKDIERHCEQLATLVACPTHYCKKCARVANRSKVLCKSAKLPEEVMASSASSKKGDW